VVYRITFSFSYFLFNCWFIYWFILDIKGVILSSYTTISFSSKIPKSLHLHSLTYSLLHCYLNGLLSYWTVCVRYMLLTVSSLKSLSAHNPSYLSLTDLEHTLTVQT
jgi:hypothetical protein